MKHTVLEENHQCSSSNIVSKSVESSIKIDSISIDLINAKEKRDAGNCEHFSIRGYVSDIRKKDWKMCWPFASDDDDNKRGDHECGLPPFHIPKFRYWRCQNCMSEICARGDENYYGRILKSCTGGFKSNISCSHASILEDIAVQISDHLHPQKEDIPDGKKIDANVSAIMNDATDYHPSSCMNEKQKDTETNGFSIAHDMDSDDNPHKEIHQLTSGISSVQKTCHTDGIVNLKSTCNLSVEICKSVYGHHEVAGTVLAENCTVKNATTINEQGNLTSVADEKKDLAACGISGEDCTNKKACNASKGSGLCSPELDEFDYASSDSAEIMVGNKLRHSNSSGLHRRKTRKVRLLTELLSVKGNGDTDKIRVDDSFLNTIPDASAVGDKHFVPQGRVVIQGNAKRCLGIRIHRKRKSDQDEDWRPVETSPSKRACKEVKILNRDVESAEAIAKAFARMELQTSMKNHCTKHRNDGSVIIDKGKNRKALTFDETLSTVPVKDVLIEAGETIIDASKSCAAEPNPISKAVTGREIDFFPLSAQRMDRKPSFKKKSKIPEVDDPWASFIPRNHLLREDQTSSKNVDLSRLEPVRVPFHSARDASSEGLNLSLNSYLTTHRYDMQPNLLVEDIRTPLLTWQEGTTREDQVNGKAAETNYIRSFNFPPKPASDIPFGKGVYGDMNSQRITNSMSLHSEKQSYTSQVEIGSCSHMQQKNFCSGNSNRKAHGIQERSAVGREDSDQRANKATEQGNLDDIPMEIVELMAKHQYERCLPDVEYDRCQLEMTNTTKSCRSMNFNKSHGNAEMSLFQLDTTQKRNPCAKNSRNGITKRGENAGSMKRKVDYFCQADVNQFNVSQLHKNHLPAGLQAFFQHPEKLSSGIQHSASTSGRPNGAQSCKWIGDWVGKRSSNNCLQNSGTCNTCMGITQKNKDKSHSWSSIMPNHMPFLYSIPQKSTSLSTNIDLLSNSPGNVRKENVNGQGELKFLSENVTGVGKQNRTIGSEILRTCAEYPFACKHNGMELNKKPVGSLDLYNNETIPAMHLLSLMDAGLRSSAPINLDANQKHLNRTSAAHDQDPKEFNRLDCGAYKVSNTMKNTSYDHRGKNQHAEDSHRHISAIPAVAGPSSSSFQHAKCFKKAIDFNSQVTQEKAKGKSSDLRTQNAGYRSQKSTSPSGNFGSTNCGSFPVHSMQTMFFGGFDSAMFPLQCSGLDNPTKHKLEASNGIRPARPPKSSSETGICSVNRNPADFSIPEAGNLYMIAGEDLKFGKAVPFANAYGSTRLVGQKRQKKLPTVKEHRRHLVS